MTDTEYNELRERLKKATWMIGRITFCTERIEHFTRLEATTKDIFARGRHEESIKYWIRELALVKTKFKEL